MAANRVQLPCPVCGKPISLSLRKATQYDFQVGCVERKTISHSVELIRSMKGNEAATNGPSEDSIRYDGRERPK
jgi:hypothetical protein